ncbi:hypothetical protein ANN_19523 [Periplaneta americana]|uniref:THAP-type domain-containing protein n=1 Tax=Periplaneta americana TaxID=6978 RepID=A0ABQ8SAC1_PERAM|nr:hypothetical protein ANN_19523 [Periplaneta americana]
MAGLCEGGNEPPDSLKASRDPHRRQQWLRSIHRDNFQPGTTAIVCINHFSEQYIVREDRAVRSDSSVLVVPRKIPKLTPQYLPSDCKQKHESKFNLFASEGRKKVWRKRRTELEQQYIVSTVKHGGWYVMVWRCMASSGVRNLAFIDGKMDQYKFIAVLRDILSNSVHKLGLDGVFRFQQDNDSKHTAIETRESDIFTYGNEKLEIVNSYKYLGLTLQVTGKSFTKHIEERCSAAIKATYDIKKLEKLSTTTALRLFYIKIAPIVSYALKKIWVHLTSANLKKLEAVKASYLKRALQVSRTTQTRLVYLLMDTDFFVRELMTSNGLQPTPAYEAHVRDREEKAADVD